MQENLTKMPKALILIADGSEEIEFVTPYDGMSPEHLTCKSKVFILINFAFSTHSSGLRNPIRRRRSQK